MTIQELIKELEKYPEDALVVIDCEYCYFNVKKIYDDLTPDSKIVYIETR